MFIKSLNLVERSDLKTHHVLLSKYFRRLRTNNELMINNVQVNNKMASEANDTEFDFRSEQFRDASTFS